MDKCHGCFSKGWITCFAEALGIDQDDCHLTKADQRIVTAMIDGFELAPLLLLFGVAFAELWRRLS